MSLERDPELARLLEVGLGSSLPPAGTQARVEQRLAARFARAPHGSVRFALAATILLTALLGLFLGRALRPPGAVRPVAPALAWVPLEHARALVVGGGKLRVDHENERETVVELVAGTALFHVEKGTGRRFVVEAGESRVEVVGTIFGVALEGERAKVQVVEGRVRLHEHGAVQTLDAGESSPPGAHLFTAAPAVLRALEAPFPLPASSRLSPPALAPAASGAETARSSPERRPSPTTARVPPRPSSHAAAEPAPTPPPTPAGDDAYRVARTLERAGAVSEATSAYRALAEAPGPNADDAGFALVRLPAEHGASDAVLAAAADYRRRFPAGRYARDVDVLVLNAHLAHGDDASARSDADAFLAHFPNDARVWRFRLVRAASRARSGDCEGASRDLTGVPDGPDKASILASCPALPE